MSGPSHDAVSTRNYLLVNQSAACGGKAWGFPRFFSRHYSRRCHMIATFKMCFHANECLHEKLVAARCQPTTERLWSHGLLLAAKTSERCDPLFFQPFHLLSSSKPCPVYLVAHPSLPSGFTELLDPDPPTGCMRLGNAHSAVQGGSCTCTWGANIFIKVMRPSLSLPMSIPLFAQGAGAAA